MSQKLRTFSAGLLTFVETRYLSTIHLLLTIFLLLSTWAYSGNKWVLIFIVYLTGFSFVAYGLHNPIERWTSKISLKSLDIQTTKIIRYFLLASIFVFPVIWFFEMKGIPLWTVMMSADFYGIARFRASLTYDAPTWLTYGVEYYLKGIAPFTLLLLYHQKSKWFFSVLTITCFFALCMIAKMYAIVLLTPLLIYQIQRKQWLAGLQTILLVILSISFLCYLANPQEWPRPWLTVTQQVVAPENKQATSIQTAPKQVTSKSVAALPSPSSSSAFKLVGGIGEALYTRGIIVPGKVTDEWLSLVPEKIPFLRGCGYQKLAYLLGCDFVNMPKVVFAAVYPEMLGEGGYRGTVTASQIINAYVNFSYLGVIFSGLFLGLLLAMLEGASRDRAVLFALNTAPVILLTEMTLSSVLHTGGMFLVNLLYFIYRADFLNAASTSYKEGSKSAS